MAKGHGAAQVCVVAAAAAAVQSAVGCTHGLESGYVHVQSRNQAATKRVV